MEVQQYVRPPMTLVRGLAVYCLNHACRHQTVIGVDDYADESRFHLSAAG